MLVYVILLTLNHIIIKSLILLIFSRSLNQIYNLLYLDSVIFILLLTSCSSVFMDNDGYLQNLNGNVYICFHSDCRSPWAIAAAQQTNAQEVQIRL